MLGELGSAQVVELMTNVHVLVSLDGKVPVTVSVKLTIS